MDILNVLKQLRDDLKTWVTNNLNALNAKIDEKTIPIDDELSTTSTNPVQNKTITKAIKNIPTFSGDYNDLTNAPDISEDGSGNMTIADESGNIIFKTDAYGIHTTALSLNGESAATESYVNEAVANIDIPEVDFTGYATEDYVAQSIETVKTEISESIVSESNEWKIVDEEGNIIFSVDADGAHTTNMSLEGNPVATETYVNNAVASLEIPETDLTDYYNKIETDTALANLKTEISESIMSESEEWTVVDNNGNIVATISAAGLETTTVIAQNVIVNGEEVSASPNLDNYEFITVDDIDTICGTVIQVINSTSEVTF